MKPSSILTALITAVAAPAAAAPTNAALTTDVAPLNSTLAPRQPRQMPMVWCQVHQPSMLNQYKVIIRRVARPDVGPLCASLWKELKGFQLLCMVSSPHCGHAQVVPGEPALEWKFTTGAGCNGGAIGAAYWGATHNKYGAMDVSGCN